MEVVDIDVVANLVVSVVGSFVDFDGFGCFFGVSVFPQNLLFPAVYPIKVRYHPHTLPAVYFGSNSGDI
jgi:hypothetical protein